MGMFAFRRMREREAASKEVASFLTAEPKLEPLEPLEQTADGNRNRGNSRRGKLKLLPDAG